MTEKQTKWVNIWLMSLLVGFIVGSAVGHGQPIVAVVFIGIWLVLVIRHFYADYKLYKEKQKQKESTEKI